MVDHFLWLVNNLQLHGYKMNNPITKRTYKNATKIIVQKKKQIQLIRKTEM